MLLRLLCRKLQPHSPSNAIPHNTPLPFLFHDPFARPIIHAPPPSIVQKSPISSCAVDANSDSVLRMLRSHDISDGDSKTIFTRLPKLLTIKPEKTLKPKLDFLRGAGFTSPEVTKILLANPSLLQRNLERSLASSVNFLKATLPSKEAVIRVLKSTNKLLTPKQEANINILKDRGVPDSMILKLLFFQPRSLARGPDRFVDTVEDIERLGLAPTSSTFVTALGVMSYMSKSTFLRKVELYREMGWSNEEIFAMFKKQPSCLGASDELIRKKMGYFKETIGWDPEFLCSNPVILMLSLEKRIIPRCAVLNILMSRGLVKKETRSPSKFLAKEKSFFENFVKKYEEEVPEIVKAYQGKIKFQGWEWLKDV